MLLYLIKRLLAMIPTLLGITLITFIIINLAPGNPVDTQFAQGGSEMSAEGGSTGNQAQNQEEQQAKLKAKKELLGMVEKDFSVYQWNPNDVSETDSDAPDAAPTLSLESIGELSSWPQSLQKSSDGKLYAGTKDGQVYRIDPQKGEDGASLLQSEGWHESSIHSLAISLDGSVLVSADVDGWVASWDTTSGEQVATSRVAESWIRAVEFLPDGKRVLVASDDAKIRVLDAATLTVQQTLKTRKRVHSMLPRPDGQTVWVAGASRNIEEWSLETGEKTREGFSHRQTINDMALSPDGTTLVTGCDDKLIRTMDVSGDWEATPTEFGEHWKQVSRVIWSEDGSQIWSGSKDETVRLWDAASGEEIARSEKVGAVYTLIPWEDGIMSGSTSYSEVNLIVQYFNWLSRMARFDYGRSISDDEPVMDKLLKALPVTIGLNLIAIIIIYVVSIPLGVYAAVKRNGWFDQISSIVLFLLYSIPNFWLASLLIMFFATVPCWMHGTPLPPDELCTELTERTDGDSAWSTDATRFCEETIEDRDELQTVGVCINLHDSYSDFDQCRIDLEPNMDEVLGDKPRYEAMEALDASSLPPKDKAAISEMLDLSDGSHWDVLPSGGLESLEAAGMSYWEWLLDRIKHLFLPILVMTYAGFASLSRYARTTMLETIQEDFVRTARAKGLSERVVVYKHAFRNSLITIVTLMGNLLPAMIGGSVIVEYIFNIQGMGLLGFDAILQRDYPVIMAITSFSAFLTLLGILLSDILYSVVDPRVSQE